MTRPCDILIQAACIVTQDGLRTVVENGALAVADGMVLDVGPREAVAAAHAPARVLDLGDALVLPGLVNAHTHAAMTFLRGVADDLPLMEWLTQHIFPVEKHLTPDIVEAGALLGCAEMLRTGTTAFNDMYLIQDATYRAVDKAGMRCLGGEGIFGFPSPAYPDADAGLALVRQLHERWRHNPRIRQCVTPHAVYTTSPELLQRCQALAEELDLPLHIHLAETTTETAQCQQMFGQRPVPYCHGLGLLTPRATVAHAVDLTDDEIELLARTGAAVAHNPESNMKLASGAAPVVRMLQRRGQQQQPEHVHGNDQLRHAAQAAVHGPHLRPGPGRTGHGHPWRRGRPALARPWPACPRLPGRPYRAGPYRAQPATHVQPGLAPGVRRHRARGAPDHGGGRGAVSGWAIHPLRLPRPGGPDARRAPLGAGQAGQVACLFGRGKVYFCRMHD